MSYRMITGVANEEEDEKAALQARSKKRSKISVDA